MRGAKQMLRLQFEANQIKRLEKGYLGRQRVKYTRDARQADKLAKDAGTKIRNGEPTKETLKEIFRWKNASSRFYERLV
jgi:hypothetical protein